MINRISAHRSQSPICKFPNKSRTALSRRSTILAAATAWVAPLKRTAIQAAAAAWSGRSRRSAVLVTAAATVLVVAASYQTPGVRGDTSEYYIGGNGGYWGTASNWNQDEVPSSSGTYNQVDTNVGSGSGSDNIVDLHGSSFTVGEITGTNAGDIAIITNTFSTASLLIDPASMSTATGSTINSDIEGDSGDLLTLQIGKDDGSDSSIIAELYGFIGESGNNDVKVILDGVEGNADFVEANNYTGGTTIENGAMAIAETATSFGSGTITFQNTGGTIQLGSSFTEGDIIANAVKLTASATIDSNGSGAYFSGNFTGNGGLTITDTSAGGGGYVYLSGTNNYTGGTTITSNGQLTVTGTIKDAVTDDGKLFISHNNITITDLNGSSSGYLAIGDLNSLGSYTLNISPTAHSNDTFAGTITEGSGSFTGSIVNFSGASSSTFTLTGTLDNIGAISINSGTVVVTDGGYLNANDGSLLATTVGANGTLTVSGTGSVEGFIYDNGIFNVQTNDTLTALTGTGSVAISGGETLTIDNTSNIGTFAGVISGNGGLTVMGSFNALVLSGNNTYSGGTTIDANAILSVTGTIEGSVTDKGTFDINNSFGITDFTGSGKLDLGSGETLTVAPTGTNNDIYSGTIIDSGNLTVNGASGATLTLQGADSSTGTTTISGGTLDVNTGGSISGGPITINGLGTLTISGTGTADVAITDNGTFNVENSASITDLTGSSSGKIIITSGDTLTVHATTTDVFNGVISDTGGVGGNLELASGTLTLTGANTYGDATTIDSGATMTISSTGSIVGAITDNGTLNVQNSLPGITDLNGTNTNAAIIISSGKMLTVAPTGVDTFGGTIGGVGGKLAVNGATGTSLELDGALSYTGTTTIGSAATLILTNGADSIGAVQFGTGAGLLEVQNNLSVTDLTGTSNAAQIIISSASYTLTVTPSAAASDTFAGAIGGSGSLDVEGASGTKLTLTGTNTYTGNTGIGATADLIVTGSIASSVTDSGGTFGVQNSFTIGDLNGSGTITLGSGDVLTVDSTGSDAFSGKVSGAGGLDLASDDLTLSGPLTYTGLTTVGDSASLTLSGAGDSIGGVDIQNLGTFTIGSSTVNITDLNGAGSVSIGTGDTLIVAPTTTDDLSGNISGGATSNLTVDGASGTSLELDGTLSYTGTTTLGNSATLIITGANTIGAVQFNGGHGTLKVQSDLGITDILNGTNSAASIVIGSDDTLTVNSTGIDSFAGVISGSGGNLELASGTLTLTGANTYGDATTIDAGATLDVTGTIVGAVTNNGTLNVENNLPAITDLAGTSAAAIINITGSKTFTVAPTGTDDYEGKISGAGNLAVNGNSGTSLELDGLLSYTGTTTLGPSATLILDNADSIGGVAFGNSAGDNGELEVKDNVSITDLNGFSTAAQLIIDTGDVLSVSPTMADDFEGAISGGGTLTLTEGTLTLSGTVNGVTLIQDAGSNLIWTGSSTIYNPSGSGNVTIASGQTLTVIQSTSSDWQANISGAGNLTVDSASPGPSILTLSGTLAYTGLTTIGDGVTVILDGTDDDIGGVHVDTGGTFSIDPNVTIGDLTGGGSTTIASGDTLTSIPTTNDTYTGVISGLGAFTLGTGSGGVGSLTLTGNNTYTGGTTITNTNTLSVSGSIVDAVTDNGTLNVENSFAITDLNGNATGKIVISSGDALTVNTTTTDGFSGVISDTGGLGGSLEVGGTGSLTLTGVNTYIGGTTIDSGATLSVGGLLGTGSITGAVTDNGTFNVQNSFAITDLTGASTGSVVITSGDTFTVDTSRSDVFSGVISDTGGGIGGALVVGGTGKLTLAGVNTYGGGTSIGTGATLVISSTGSIKGALTENGTLDTANSLTLTDLNGSNTAAAINIQADSTTLTVAPTKNDSFAGAISGAGYTSTALTVNGAHGTTLTLTGNVTNLTNVNVNSGTVLVTSGGYLSAGTTAIASGATLTVSSTGSMAGSVTDDGIFNVNNSFTIGDLTGTSDTASIVLGSGDVLTVDSTGTDMYAGSISGAGGLTLATGTLELTGTGTITYTGTTTIDSGSTLEVSGTLVGPVIDDGTLDVLTNQTIGNLTGSGDLGVFSGQTLTIQETGTSTFSGDISGDGGLTITSGTTGDLITTGALVYKGLTTIDSGATLTLSGTGDSIGGVDVMGGGTFAITPNASITDLTGAGTVSIGLSETLTSSPTTNDTFTGIIIGSGAFTLGTGSGGAGTSLTLTGNNTYSGGTTITDTNTLSVSGSITGAVTDSGTFNVENNLSITDLTGASTGLINITAGDTLTVAPTTGDTFNGVIAGTNGSLVVNGASGTSLTLTGVNTYGETTTIGSTATLTISSTGSDNDTSLITIDSGGTLNVAGTIAKAVADNGIFNVQNTFGITDLTGESTGVINITSDDTLTVAPTHGSNDVFSGTITGGSGGGLTVDGTATNNSLTLSGDLSGYEGLTTIQNNGTLKIDYTDNLPSTSAFTFLSGSGTGDILDFVGSGAYTQTLGTVTLGGDDTIDAGGSGNTVTFNDQIVSGSSSNKITLQNGTFVIGAAADLSLFTAGTVKIGNGTGTNASAVLEFSTVLDVPISGAATVEFDDGTADYTGTGALDLPSFVTYTVDAAGGLIENTGTTPGTIEIDGNITDSTNGTLTFSGGTFELTSDNTSTLTSGTIAIGDAPAVMEIENQDAFGSAAVSVNNGSTLETSNFVAGNLTAGAFNITAASYLQDSTSTLQLQATGESSSVSDNFALGSGVASLNGTLSLQFLDNPFDFDTYTIVNTTGKVTDNGTFNNSVTVQTIDGPVVISGNPSSAANAGWSSIVDANVTTDEKNGVYLRFWQNTISGAISGNGQQVIVQTLFSGDAQTQNELNVAEYLDNNATPGSTTPALQAQLTALSELPGNKISSILNEFTPTDYADLPTQNFQNSTFLDQQVFSQIANGFGGGGINTNGLAMLPTDGAVPDPFSMALQSQLQSTAGSTQQAATYMDNYNSWSVGEPVPSAQQQPQQSQPSSSSDQDQGADQNEYPAFLNSWSAFVAGDVVVSNTPSGNPNGQPHYTTGGMLVGAGVQLDDNWSVGGFFNWNYTGATLDSLGSHQQTKSYTPGLFVGYQNDGWYANGLASYTYNTYRIDDNVMGTTATGTPTSNQYDLAVLGGYNIPVSQNFQIGPAVGLDYTHVDVSGYSETGSPFDLNVGSTSADSLRTLLGGQGQYTFPGNSFPMPLDLNFNAFWQHEFLNSSQGITASFSQVSSPSSFIFNTAAPTRDSLLLGGGVTGHINQSISLFVNYEMQVGENSLFGQSVMAGVAIGFK